MNVAVEKFKLCVVLFLLRESNSLILNLGNSPVVLFLVNNNML